MFKENQKWDDSCNNDLCEYKPHNHTHTQIIGKNLKKDCEKCGSEMGFDVHLYECEFGKNYAQFRNIYICRSCHHKDSFILYTGQPKDITKVFIEAEKAAYNYQNLSRKIGFVI